MRTVVGADLDRDQDDHGDRQHRGAECGNAAVQLVMGARVVEVYWSKLVKADERVA